LVLILVLILILRQPGDGRDDGGDQRGAEQNPPATSAGPT